ncbi:hypothetical protein F5Y17DRAFT_25493 [Xylariaceae sp. FL0594]|nr:hypothetical protein F5Y17DRAFT_25493 [Xylariaceae sp. FL0594]
MPTLNANNQVSRQASSATAPRSSQWRDGQVVFLKWADSFDDDERRDLLDSGHLHARATGHPVIILYSTNDGSHFIVSTVSAYSSSDSNGNLPPWQQPAHRRKCQDDFRAFKGSARPNDKHAYLHLAAGQQWPKPKTSWVFVQRPFLVPASVLFRYTKAQGRQLSLTSNSLNDLRQHSWHRSCLPVLKKKLDAINLRRNHNGHH